QLDALASIAQIHLLQGNANAAFERVSRQLDRTKAPALVYQLLGQLKLGEKDLLQAIAYLKKAVELDPNLLSAYLLIGNIEMAQKKLDDAIANYQKVIDKNPQAIPAYMLLGAAYDQKQQYAKANEFYQKVLDINRDFAPAANNLAWNYAQYGGNLDTALSLA